MTQSESSIQSFDPTSKSKEIKEFIEQVIKVRRHLLLSETSKKNEMRMGEIVDRLDRYINAFSSTNPVNMANFLRKNYDDIYSILPGEGSKSHKALYEKMKSSFNDALQIINISKQ